MNLHIGMAWSIHCCNSRCRIFIEPLENFTTDGSHSWPLPKSSTRHSHRPSSQGCLDCRRSVSIGHLLLTICLPSSSSSSQWSPPCHLLAQCFCLPLRCRYLSCVISLIDLRHGRRRWRSRWSLAFHWDQSSQPSRRTEAKDWACAEALILEAEGAVCSCGDLLKLQWWRLLRRWLPRQRKHYSQRGVIFYPKNQCRPCFQRRLDHRKQSPKNKTFRLTRERIMERRF